jgi:ThiF family protein
VTIVGRSKVALARDHVRRVNPWSAIATIDGDIASLSPGHLAGLDAVVLAVDNERARFLAARLAVAARVPLIDAAVRADLFTARVTVSAAGGPCLVDGWSSEHLARAGEDVGLPCMGLDAGPPYGSALCMAQAGAALATHQLLGLLGVTGEPAWCGHELRLDLHAGRLERFGRPLVEACAADHALAGAAATLDVAPGDTSLGRLMRACRADVDTDVLLAATELVACATCSCGGQVRPYRPRPLGACQVCGADLVPLRRVRRVRWGEAAPALADASADVWFRPGDIFVLSDGGATRAFAFAPPSLPWEEGRPWSPEEAATRLARLPRRYDLTRIRTARLGLLGLGHLGAAILEAIAPLPWAAVLLLDRDRFETCNIAAHVLAAAEGPAS